MKREIGFLMSFLCLLLIVGCSHTESTSNHDAPSKTEKPGKQKDEKSESTYSLVGDEIEKEPGGELFQKYIESKEFADQNEYADAEAAAVDHYIQSIKKVNTKNWDEEKWAQSIVTNFRSEYKKTIQPMRDLEIKYKELKLPDGRLLQDVSEEELESQPKKVNIALLLDASGSMKANVPGGNKMKLAKASLNSFSKSLPGHTKILLSVFGHKGTGDDKDKKLSCKSVETVYPLQPYNKKDFSYALNKFNASGWTPLASAIKKAQALLQKVSDDQTKNFIYVVSDGIETCGGNPVQAAKDAKASNMDVQINIIGFDVDDEADRQLKEVARAGGGEYTTVRNKQQLNDEITKSWKETIGKTTWVFWNVGNINNINWDSVRMSQQLNEMLNKHIDSRNRERNRMNAVVSKLEENKLIDFDVHNKISEILSRREHIIKDYADKINKDKNNEIFEIADRLKKKVNQMTEDK